MHAQAANGPPAPTGDDVESLDRQSLLHPFTRVSDYAAGDTPAPFIVARAEGVNVFDQAGKGYIDGFSALYCVNAGYGQRRIIDAMHAQAEALPYFHIFAGATHEPAVRLADKLLQLAGPDMKRVFFGTSGSDANETQVKLVWYANNVRGKPNKKKIIARRRGYHGGTIVTASLTGLPIYHQGFDLVSSFVRHTLAPDSFWGGGDDAALVQRCVDDLERLILEEGPDTVGGFIAEPMIGAGGAVPPPPGYWPAIQEVLARYDVLLILDEVVTGFGRVGEMMGSTVWGITPDLVTLAKGLTSGYAPLSAVLVGEKVWHALQAGTQVHGMFGHGFTYTAHPLGAAAALANIAVIEDNQLCANARTVGAYLFSSLKQRFEGRPLIGQVRGVGLFGAVEFVAEGEPLRHLPPELKFAARITTLARGQGLLVRTMPYGDIVGLAPPLILTRAEADAIVDRLERAYEAALAELTPSQRRGEPA
ncbi:MAG: aminotransferase class III-fold pyridoxal phosphate-dependent enzyme [Caulobacterales bacterium]